MPSSIPLRAVAVLGVCAATVALSACSQEVSGQASASKSASSQQQSDDRPVAVGDCFAGPSSDDQLTDDYLVDCTEPHEFEVLDVQDLPADYTGDDRAGLDEGPGALHDEFIAYADDTCVKAVVTAIGMGSLLDLPPAEDGLPYNLVPVGGAQPFYTQPDDAAWSAGERTLICGVRLPESLASDTAEPIMAGWLEDGIPSSLRHCEWYASDSAPDPDAVEVVDCTEEHDFESLFAFDAASLVGTDVAAAIDPPTMTDEQYGALDDLCVAVAGDLVPRTAGEVSVTSLVTDGWGGETSSGTTIYRLDCGVWPTSDAQRLVHSVFDSDVALVPRT